jgi:Right handed beta helix region
MKAIASLLFLLIIITACVQENKPVSVATLPQTGSSPIPAIIQDTSSVSVVNPIIPGRTITVGGANADIKGFSSEAIQTAIESLRNSGNGGTVVLLPGNYDIASPVRIYDNMTLTGSGEKTVLKKCKGFSSPFALDADYGELKITVKDASGFKPGMGVAIYDDTQRSGWDLTTAKITAIKGNDIYIDEYLLRDYHADKNGTLSNSCSVISAVEAENVTISNLTVDGSRESNDMIDGCRAGGIYLHKVHKALVENVIVKNYNSDGISWQLTEYVTVRNCEVYGCSNSGLHPGTGSPYTLIEGNKSHDNGGYGLFVCWRVRNGIVRNNIFKNNGKNGICTGHKDTDMLYEGNTIAENGADGIHLRGELTMNAPHRSIFKNNLIENNGMKEKGYGLSVNCKAEGVVLEDNILRNTGSGKQAGAVLLMPNSLPVEMKNNKITGFPEEEVVKQK